MFRRKAKWSAAPSGRQIVNRELFEKVAQEAYQDYTAHGLSPAQVAERLNQRYKGARFHEQGVRLLFADFLLPLREEHRPRPASRPVSYPTRHTPRPTWGISDASRAAHQAIMDGYAVQNRILTRGY